MEDISSRLSKLISSYPIQVVLIVFIIGCVTGSILSYYILIGKEVECPDHEHMDDNIINETEGVEIGKIGLEERAILITHTEDIPVEKEVCVDIEGAVKKPGVYCLPQGTRLVDVLYKAGGFITDRYAYKYVSKEMNFSLITKDQEKVYIPFFEDTECTMDEDPNEGLGEVDSDPIKQQDDTGDDEGIDDCLDINLSTEEDLLNVPGVGEVTAQKIVDARPYEMLEDLLSVSGIGDSKFKEMEPYLCPL